MSVRTHFRNRREALRAWRSSIRDIAVLALYDAGGRMPLVQLAASIGVDVGGLRGLLEPDPRFRILMENCRRNVWGHRQAIFVALLPHSSPVAQGGNIAEDRTACRAH
jgi:hypothetical protein